MVDLPMTAKMHTLPKQFVNSISLLGRHLPSSHRYLSISRLSPDRISQH